MKPVMTPEQVHDHLRALAVKSTVTPDEVNAIWSALEYVRELEMLIPVAREVLRFHSDSRLPCIAELSEFFIEING